MRFGMGMAVLSATTFGTSGPLARLLIDAGWSPVAVAMVRLALAAAILAVPMAVVGRKRLATLRHAPLTVLAYGTFGVLMAQLCFFNAVRYMDVAVALLIEYSAPLLVIAFDWAVRGRRPGATTLVGAAIAIAGLLIVIGGNGIGSVDPVGVAWACAAAIGLAGYFVLAEEDPDSGCPAVDPLALATGGLLVGSALVAMIAATGLLPMQMSTDNISLHGAALPWWSAALAIAVISTVVAYVSGITAVRWLGVTVASFVALLEVASSGVWSWVLLDQMLSPSQMTGGAVLLGGVIVVRSAAARPVPEIAEPVPVDIPLVPVVAEAALAESGAPESEHLDECDSELAAV